MTFTEAAEAVLRKVGKPLHYKKITQLAIEQNLLSHVGKTPEVTMSTRLATLAKKDRGEALIVRMKPGVFGLRDWGPAAVEAAEDEPEGEEIVAEGELPEEGSEEAGEGESAPAVVHSPEERERAQRLVAAAQLFPEEADDNDPVMAEKPAPAPVVSAAGAGGAAGEGDRPAGEAGRRRRRRRRRGGRGGERVEGGAPGANTAEAGAGGEGFDAVFEGEEPGDDVIGDGDDEGEGAPGEPMEGRASEPGGANGDEPIAEIGAQRTEGRREPRRDDRRYDGPRNDERRDERPRNDDRRDERPRGEEGSQEAGRDAADLIVSLLTRRDDRQALPIRTLVDDAIRSGKLGGDPGVLASTLAAAARVDAARREMRGERPRLRVVNGRVGLVDWTLGPDLVRAESDALIALERMREAARRQLIRRLNELPQNSFTELVVLLLERLGVSSLRSTRRPGLPQGEIHLAGVARRANEELRVAVLIKRGGEVGRERVIELRGSLHHYGPATTAWVVTTGNVLSGAREEAAQAGTAPVSLIDGATLGRLMDENGVGVRHANVQIPYVDLDLFDALRGAG